MYEYNICSPIWQITPAGTDLRIMRYLFLTILICLFLMYFIITIILKRSIRNLKADDSGSRLQIQRNFYQQWDREYTLMMGDHAIAVGFVMCFSPYLFEVILSVVFLILRVAYEIRKQTNHQTIKQIKTILRIINLALLLCAMVGLSRSQWDYQRQHCRDPQYRFT